MIDYTAWLHPADLETLQQFDSFLARVSPAFGWWVGPVGLEMDQADISIAYAERDDGRGLNATAVFSLADTRVAFITDLHAALRFLAAMADDPELHARSSVVGSKQPLDQAQQRLGVVSPDLVTKELGSQHVGYHLTQSDSDWVAYLVEDRGQVMPLARSDNPVALLVYLYVCDETEGSDLDERLAACLEED